MENGACNLYMRRRKSKEVFHATFHLYNSGRNVVSRPENFDCLRIHPYLCRAHERSSWLCSSELRDSSYHYALYSREISRTCIYNRTHSVGSWRRKHCFDASKSLVCVYESYWSWC